MRTPRRPARTVTIGILGGRGQIGAALQAAHRALPPQRREQIRLIITGHADLDITQPAELSRAVGFGGVFSTADVLINCAGYTDILAAEGAAHTTARAVNTDGLAFLGRAVADLHDTSPRRLQVIHLSCAEVYSPELTPAEYPAGLPTSAPTEPHSIYGITLHAGERALRTHLPNAIIVRAGWVYSGPQRWERAVPGDDLVTRTLAAARRIGEVRGAVDRIGTPTCATELAGGILDLAVRVHAGQPGPRLVHATAAGATSEFAAMERICQLAGIAAGRITPVQGSSFGELTPQAPMTVLDDSSWRDWGLAPLQPWEDALALALQPQRVRS